MLAVAGVFKLSLSVPLLGAAICITWSVSVSDPNPRDQRVTTLLMWVPAAACVAIGTLSGSLPYLEDALFLAVLFVAVYIRRFGPRYNALGMIAVIPFFFTLFLRASAQTLPWLMVANSVRVNV